MAKKANKQKLGRTAKYTEWLTPEGLLKIEGWARDGLTDEQIATKIGIVPSTLYAWKDKFSELSETLKRGKEVIDREVENALLKRARGYEYTESEYEVVSLDDVAYSELVYRLTKVFKDKHPEATDTDIRKFQIGIPKEKRILIKQKTKEVAPDTTAAIFWLKNRKPSDWKDKQEIAATVNHTSEQIQAVDEYIQEKLKKGVDSG